MRLADKLLNRRGFQFVSNLFEIEEIKNDHGVTVDIRKVYKKGTTVFYLHSDMDELNCIIALQDNLSKLASKGIKVDMLITTCRRFDDSMHNTTLQIMNWSEREGELFDCQGQKIIRIPLIKAKYSDNNKAVIEKYAQCAATLALNIIDSIL